MVCIEKVVLLSKNSIKSNKFIKNNDLRLVSINTDEVLLVIKLHFINLYS